MTVEEQIADTEYFLKAIRRSDSREELRPNIGAFLAMSRSIADHLLEEYNVKFGLGIGLLEKLTPRTFKEKAENQNNQTALDFIEFYTKVFKKLKENRSFSLLYHIRNVKIHRAGTRFRAEFFRGVSDEVKISDSINVTVIRKNGTVEDHTKQQDIKMDNNSRSNEFKIPHKDQKHTEDGVKWYLTDYDIKGVPDLCQDFLESLKEFANIIYTKFP